MPRYRNLQRPRGVLRLLALAGLLCGAATTIEAGGVAAFTVDGDAVVAPLSGTVGRAAQGRAVVLDRAVGNCLVCHQIGRERNEPQQGTIGPSLDGVGRRLTPGQLRLRIIDQSRLDPRTIMPPYHRTEGLNRIAPADRGRPMLDAQQVEDVVAYLATL
jgi:sulfur-oxidizing protein SoxX